MTRLSLIVSASLLLLLAACATSEGPPEGSTGSPPVTASETPAAGKAGNSISEKRPSPSATAIVPEEPDDTCGASKITPWVGKEATVPVRIEVVRATGARGDRWLYPDSPATMDYSPTRLNVIMEKGTDKIVSARCG